VARNGGMPFLKFMVRKLCTGTLAKKAINGFGSLGRGGRIPIRTKHPPTIILSAARWRGFTTLHIGYPVSFASAGVRSPAF
jgi:hypothetical protein